MGSRCSKTVQLIFTDERLEQLKALLHCSPRDFGKDTSRGLNWASEELGIEFLERFVIERNKNPREVCDLEYRSMPMDQREVGKQPPAG